MDPQHRLLLEVAWEALEDGALTPHELGQGSTGVFVGITSGEYGTLLLRRGGATRFDGHCMTGTPLFSAAGRLSYTFGLQGPSMSLDTACSSSLTALHLACQSLRQGECKWALAGGVNLLLSPEVMTALCRTGALSSGGRCRSFSAEADGYARGEGCGVLVLARLDEALAAGYRVRAIVRNSGVNHNGASGGYTVPSGRAQEELIRRVWQQAQVSPADVDYVEAHATATPLGDPVEVRALARVLGKTRLDDRPLLIGSAKTNLGHCESAAGVAGVIKVVLSLEQEEIPAHLHCQNLSPHVPWGEIPVRVVRQRTAWKHGERARLAGVSSFGMGGTNAHVLLEEAPRASRSAEGARPAQHLLCLSARSAAALVEQARRLREHLYQHTDLDLADVAYTTQVGRTHFAHRACLCASDTEHALELLDALVTGRPADGVLRGSVDEPLPPLAFCFQGLATAAPVPGRELYESWPMFRATMDECLRRVGPLMRTAQPPLPWSSNGSPALPSRLAAFCTAHAFGETWRSFGLSPRAVAGEGGGEHVAACFAGAVSLQALIEWIAEGRGAPPVVSVPPTSSCEIVAASALERGWHVVSIDVTSCDPIAWALVDAELAKLHVTGFVIDWASVSRGARFQRVGLPSYPFERRPCWIDDALADDALADDALAEDAAADGLPAAVSRIDQGTDTTALEDEGTLETVMVQQLQLVSRILDEQLAFLEQGP
jgi:myxalamid-type polyketide synthase MxaB